MPELPGKETSRCANCFNPLPDEAQFCPHCGQKNTSGLEPVLKILSGFLSGVFNLNSRFFRTIPGLFIPGFLSREYFRGRHLTYYRPLRLLFTTMLVFYAVLGIKYLDQMESAIARATGDEAYVKEKYIQNAVDSALVKVGYASMDTLEQSALDTLANVLTAGTRGRRMNVNLSLHREQKILIPSEELFTLEPDTILNKYEITGFMDRLIARQIIQARKHTGRFVRSFIGNTIWMVLVLMPVMAAVMKLLYIRRNRFFVEHLVVLFHYHAAVFVCLTAFVLAYEIIPQVVRNSLPILLIAYFVAVVRGYYRQGWFRTLGKSFVLLLVTPIVLLALLLLTLIVSVLVYR